MAELEFWRERASVLSGLCEQLKLPMVKRILEVVHEADLEPMLNLNESLTELNLYTVEAMENVRFLGTVERYFKVSLKIKYLQSLSCSGSVTRTLVISWT